ncbi:hypothetical protein LLG88_13680 [bacterium]|nr:hypothetical protein [bacterium]
MALTSRELPVDEWDRLAGSSIGPLLDALRTHPERVRLPVVEVDGRIVAQWAAVLQLHAEGIEVDPEFQADPVVPVRLWLAMRRAVKAFGYERVWTGADNLKIRELLIRCGGVPIAAESFVLPIVR